MLTFKYKNKLKRAYVDRRTNLQDLFAQLFSTRQRIVGLQDQEGNHYDVNQFLRTTPKQDTYTLITEEQQSNSKLLTSLKYSAITENPTNRLQYLDFIQDLDEFQQLLTGDQYTCIFQVDDRDANHMDYLISLETMILQNSTVNFYYSYARDSKRLFQLLRGNRKVVQIQLTNDRKFHQMEELIHKIQTSKSTLTTSFKQSLTISPDRPKRSKSIRRMVEESQQQQQLQHQQHQQQQQQQQQQQYSTYQPSVITRVQLTQRIPEYNSRPVQSQESLNDSFSQEQLFQLVSVLEENQIIDVPMSRLIKRLLIEENKEIISVLQGHISGTLNIQSMCEKLNKIIENSQNQQRPNSPFQQIKPAPPKSSVDLNQVREVIIERNNLNFTSEQYGMAMELWRKNDSVLINLAKDAFLKKEISLLPIQVYTQSKFTEMLLNYFKAQELALIEEYKTKRTSGIYAVIQSFRYESNMEDFIASLGKAIAQIQNINQSYQYSEKRNPQIPKDQQAKEIQLFRSNQSPKAPSPQSVLMPNFNNLQQDDNLSEKQKEKKLESQKLLKDQQEQELIESQVQQQKLLQQNQQQVQQQKSQSQSPTEQLQQYSPNRRLHQIMKSAKELIFDEENFMQNKIHKRNHYQVSVQQFYNKQFESELDQTFQEMLKFMDLELEKQLEATELFQSYDNEMYDVVKNYQSFKVVHQAKTDTLALLSKQYERRDYRKVKMFNLFVNQVRQFTIQKYLSEDEKNFLFKMFMDSDLQVLGTLEIYLLNSDAQDMLENLQIIVQQYSKHINIRSPDLQYIVPSRRESGATKVKMQARDIITQFRQYFTVDEKSRLEQIAIDMKDTRIEQLYEQFLSFSDLNGFISSMKQITIPDSIKKLQHQTLNLEAVLKQLHKDGLLKIDDFFLSFISKQQKEHRIQGVFELYQVTKNQVDLIENIKYLAKLFQRELIQKTIAEFEKDQDLPVVKLDNLKVKTNEKHKDYPKMCGAFSLYFEQAEMDKEAAKVELIETLNILC